MKKPSHPFFSTYTKSQQKGILFLLLVLVFTIGYNYYYFNYSAEPTVLPYNSNELIQRVEAQLDSVRIVREEARRTKPSSVKINFISEYNAYKIGISAEDYQKLRAYNESGKWIATKEDVALVTHMDSYKLDSIHQFLIYPNYSNNKNLFSKESLLLKSNVPKKDLNLVTESDLQMVKGIGEVISNRIIKYRLKIGGFRDEIQLKEVYGVKHETYQKLTELFEVKEKNQYTKLNLTSASVVELTEIPYFNYDLSREIKRFVDLREGNVGFDDLLKINDFPTFKLEGIKLYLEIID